MTKPDKVATDPKPEMAKPEQKIEEPKIIYVGSGGTKGTWKKGTWKGWRKKFRKTKDFKQHEFVPKVSFIAPPQNVHIPITYFDPTVINDQFILADLMRVEIGNLGWVEKRGQDFFIKEIFVPGQEVHGSECKLTPGGQAELVTQEILTRPNGAEIFNSIRYWGHCHVHMGTFASGPDEDQMDEFVGDCYDHFIRCIFNKDGRMQVTLYLIEENLLIEDAPWEVLGKRQPIDPARREYWQQVIKDKIVIKEPEPVTVYPYYQTSSYGTDPAAVGFQQGTNLADKSGSFEDNTIYD
ncbi:MAG: hypothetical protein PHT40_02960 [Patescibacteria group bacterium]|nr:hypothetical protein [Patescibacteria group bacterium]